MDKIRSAAMLATKRLAGVAPEVNLRECVTRMSPSSANKATCSGHIARSPKHEYQWPYKKGLVSSKIFFKKMKISDFVENNEKLSLRKSVGKLLTWQFACHHAGHASPPMRNRTCSSR